MHLTICCYNMSSTIIFLLLLVTLQGINTVTATPVRCSDGKHPCNSNDGEGSSAGCTEGQCANNSSDQFENSGDKPSPDDRPGCPKCLKDGITKDELTVRVMEAFNNKTTQFVVRGKILKTHLLGVNYVGVVIMVQLVMKSTHTYLTPGRLEVGVPLDPDWKCDCPGVSLKAKKSYLITGTVEKVGHGKSAGYILKVYHDSLVVPWEERILDDMVEHRTNYHKLRFKPGLHMYKKYFSS